MDFQANSTRAPQAGQDGSAGRHLDVSLLHLMQCRLLLLRLVQAQQDYTPDVLELKSKLKQLRRHADLFADLIESAIPNDHITKLIGPAMEELRAATARGTQ
jgi:hypothetical protein